jgi:hypothetical protein
MVEWEQLHLLDRATQGLTETPFYSQGRLEHHVSNDWRYPVALPVRNGYMSIGYRTAHFEKCKQLLDWQNYLFLRDVWFNIFASRLVPSWHHFCPASLTHDWGHFWFTSVIAIFHYTNIDLVVKCYFFQKPVLIKHLWTKTTICFHETRLGLFPIVADKP